MLLLLPTVSATGGARNPAVFPSSTAIVTGVVAVTGGLAVMAGWSATGTGASASEPRTPAKKRAKSAVDSKATTPFHDSTMANGFKFGDRVHGIFGMLHGINIFAGTISDCISENEFKVAFDNGGWMLFPVIISLARHRLIQMSPPS